MKKIIGFISVCFSLLIGAVQVSCSSETKTEQLEVAVYQCPMDCEAGKTYNEQDICPVCEMQLREIVD